MLLGTHQGLKYTIWLPNHPSLGHWLRHLQLLGSNGWGCQGQVWPIGRLVQPDCPHQRLLIRRSSLHCVWSIHICLSYLRSCTCVLCFAHLPPMMAYTTSTQQVVTLGPLNVSQRKALAGKYPKRDFLRLLSVLQRARTIRSACVCFAFTSTL